MIFFTIFFSHYRKPNPQQVVMMQVPPHPQQLRMTAQTVPTGRSVTGRTPTTSSNLGTQLMVHHRRKSDPRQRIKLKMGRKNP